MTARSDGTAVRSDLIVTWIVIAATALHIRVLSSDISWRNDDTLHYLNHARNIATGRAYGDTGYVYSRYSPDVGPANYPPGFPLALAPIYRIAGLESYIPYKVFGLGLLAVILALTAMWCWRLPPLTRAAGIVAVLALNPVLIRSCVTVVSDPMFTVLAVAALVWIDDCELKGRTGIGSGVVTGVLVAGAIETRSMGVAILGALVARSVARRFEGWKAAAIATVVGVALAVATNRVLHADSTVSDYTAQFLHYSWTTPLGNLRLYAGDFATEVLWPVPGMSGFAKIVLMGFLLVAAAGLWRTIRERGGLTIFEYFAGLYLVLVIAWPTAQGSRFLLPVLPWAVRLAFVGLDELAGLLTAGQGRAMRRAAVGIILFSYVPSLAAHARERNAVAEDSVAAPAVRGMLTYLSERTGADAVVVGAKPRAIALLANRRAAAFPWRQPDAVVLQFVDELHATLLVVDRLYPRDVEVVIPFVRRNAARFDVAFSNDRFAVLTIHPASQR